MSDPSATTPVTAGLPCPRCRVDLVMSERQGIEIDYCPKCRGVWLDRGELDKIIERNAQFQAPPAQNNEATPIQPPPGIASPWLAPSQSVPPGYAAGAPPSPPGWEQGDPHGGGYGKHGDSHSYDRRGGHGSGHDSMRGGHNSFLGRLFG